MKIYLTTLSAETITEDRFIRRDYIPAIFTSDNTWSAKKKAMELSRMHFGENYVNYQHSSLTDVTNGCIEMVDKVRKARTQHGRMV